MVQSKPVLADTYACNSIDMIRTTALQIITIVKYLAAGVGAAFFAAVFAD